ncbi:MAG: hypothetical protein LWX83_05790 [Anaerolineae bacterium]|nr:hypothetical protein [Anaerolineae bacterium]
MMEVLTRWNLTSNAPALPELERPDETVLSRVEDYQSLYQKIWWASERCLPSFVYRYSAGAQKENEKDLDTLLKNVTGELKSGAALNRDFWSQRVKNFATKTLFLDDAHIEWLQNCGILQAFQSFVKMARAYDALIPVEDIYQAGRNVMTANFIQLLLGLPVRVSPSIFAYSMLYPYTDNYLDDPAVSQTEKLAFNRRFYERLLEKEVYPANAHESRIMDLIGMIESEWDRNLYPQVYQSLLAIHAAQTHSLGLVEAGVSAFELDVAGITFEKGGTSVLADGYLAAGNLTDEQARLLFGFGTFTQLMDDLEDLPQDQHENRASLFSLTAGRWPLESLTWMVFHYGRTVVSDLEAFPAQDVSMLKSIIERCLDLILINTVAQIGRYYRSDTLKMLQQYTPLRFDALQKMRTRLSPQKINYEVLISKFC